MSYFEKVSTILKLSKLFRIHSKDATLFKSLFIASVLPLINDLVLLHNDKYMSEILFKLCKNDLLSSTSIQTSLDIAYEVIKKHKNKNKNKKEEKINEHKQETEKEQESEIEKEQEEKSMLCIDNITQIPYNVLSNVFTFMPLKELLSSTQFVSHQFIYSIRQPLIIHYISEWLSHKIMHQMTSSNDISNGINGPLPSFYKLSQSVSHLSLQFNHSTDIFTDLMLFKMNVIPKLTSLKSINICDVTNLWNHQPQSSNNIIDTLKYIADKNKLNFNFIQLSNIRIDYALFKHISMNFPHLKQLKISTQPRSIFKNILFNHNNLNVTLLNHIDSICCALLPSKATIIAPNNNMQKQYIDLCKLRISKFLQFIIHKKLTKLGLHIKPLEFLNDIFSIQIMQTMSLLRLKDFTLSIHENINCYQWCSKILYLTGALKYFHLIFESISIGSNDNDDNYNTSEKIFVDLLDILWNKNQVCIEKISITMKWTANMDLKHGFCQLFKFYYQFWKQKINETNFGNKSFRFEIYIDCPNTITTQLLNQLMDFTQMIKKHSNLSLVLQIGCFDNTIHKYLTKQLSLFQRVDSVPSDYLSKTIVRAQI